MDTDQNKKTPEDDGLSVALETLTELATDKSNEPSIRFQAAQAILGYAQFKSI